VGALKKMGYQGLQDVRRGKYFEIVLNGGMSRAQAEAEIENIGREVLTNPVIKEFRFTLEDRLYRQRSESVARCTSR
jgi:phosphoribosylformylglycinamidine synthase subunit PurS